MWKFKKNKPTKGDEHPGIATLLPPARCFTYNDILRMTANFSHLIGKEAFSEVYSGFAQSGLRVAVKKIIWEETWRLRSEVYNEVGVLARIHHRKLVPLVGLCEEGKKVMLVYEYMAGGNLSEALLASNSELTWRKRLQIAQDVALGLHYLHTGCKPSVIHRDIKSRNIFLDDNMDAKLSGFELSRDGADDGSYYGISTRVVGTVGYLAPEYLSTGRVSEKCDVYSFGVVLFQLVTGKPTAVFRESDETFLLSEWVMTELIRGDMENILDPRLKGRCNIESVRKVLRIANTATQEDPRGRPDMADIISVMRAAMKMEIPLVDIASSSEISTSQAFKETTQNPQNPFAGVGDDDSPRFNTLPKETCFADWAETMALEKATNGTARAETSSTKEAGIVASGMPGRTADGIATGSAPHEDFPSSSPTMEAAQPSSAMEYHLSRNINETTLVTTPARRFTYNEILSITDNYGRVIGQGGFATVYYGQLKEGGVEVAVKKIKGSSSEFSNELLGEVNILVRIHHRNLVSLVGFCEDGNEIILVSEYMASGNLSSILKGQTAGASELTWKKRLQMALGVATGLEYLHKGCKPAIIHGDIKSANILLDKKLEAKLADFGMSKASECSAFQMSKVAGTPGYIDPAYFMTQTLTKKSDVYSFGVVLFELITGKPAVVQTESNEWCHITNWLMPMLIKGEIGSLLDPILQGNCNITSVMEVANIARAATARHPRKRPDMADIVSKLKAALRMEIP